jgi:hypothetical protein
VIAQMEWVGTRIGGPTGITALVTGLWMVLRSGAWGFSQMWILGGLIILLFLFVVGIGFHVPQYRRIQGAIQKEGVETPTVQRPIKQSFAATRVEVIALAGAMFLMVFKPGL